MTATWLVRGGSDGRREASALADGLVIIGWEEIGDLRNHDSRDDFRAAVVQAYPGSTKTRLANWAGQLWGFARVMQVGDQIVMPLKTHPGAIAIGRIVGDYEYRAEAKPDFRHVRPVEWVRRDVPRDSFGQDLRLSMGSLLTVCQLKRYGATRRIAEVAAGRPDPGPSPAELAAQAGSEIHTPQEFLAEVEAAGQPVTLTVRDLLAKWKASRRTVSVVERVRADLSEQGLTTTPSFSQGWIDGKVSLVPINEPSPDHAEASSDPAATEEDLDEEGQALTLTIGNLRSASAGVVSVRAFDGDALRTATTLMILHRYSQLAVVDADGRLAGAVSWESIAKHQLKPANITLTDVMFQPRTVRLTEDLLGLLPEISTRDFVVVVADDGATPVGIVTSADLTGQFETLARPFVLLEEAERRMRRRLTELLDSQSISVDEVRKAIGGRRFGPDASGLTMGNYCHILKDPQIWTRFDWPLHQATFLDRLERVREIRNSLMHFSTDGPGHEQFGDLQGFVGMLRIVDPRP